MPLIPWSGCAGNKTSTNTQNEFVGSRKTMQNDSRGALFFQHNVTPLEPGVLLLAGGAVSHPKTPEQLQRASVLLSRHNVGTILNVSSGEHAGGEHIAMYKRHGIFYEEIPIDDTATEPVRPDFLPRVMAAFRRHQERTPDRAMLVNCSAGINRSALAAAAILWKLRPWASVAELITYMRTMQHQHRGSPVLLVNQEFITHLEHYTSTTPPYIFFFQPQ